MLKTISIWVIVFVFLLGTINLSSAVLLRMDIWDDEGVDHRAALPNYPDKAYATLVLEEYATTQGRLDYEPFVEWKRMPFEGETVTVGGDGDRVDDVPDPTDPSAKSVHFFGGSTMWGTGADDNGTIPAIYARMNPDRRIFNHGETAYVSRQGLERLIALIGEGASMDVAISYDGANDIAVLCRDDTSLGGHAKEADFTGTLLGSKEVSFREAISKLLFSETKDLIDRLVREDEDQHGGDEDIYFCDNDPRGAQAVAKTLLGHWQRARDL
ncbi:MAG TPA: hypothetical protein VE174_07210, partial [Actinomycetota bacterium]|nr:hypothetical protein [Actinomycetota bacterium]